MLTQRTSLTAAVFLVFAVIGTSSSRAGFVHVSAGVEGVWVPSDPLPENGNFGPISDYWNRGTASASAVAALGRAFGSANIKLGSFHFDIDAGSEPKTGSVSDVSSMGQWIDVLRINRGALEPGLPETPPPSQIQVHLSVHGRAILSIPDPNEHGEYGYHGAYARFGISEFGHSGLIEKMPSDTFGFQSEVWLGINSLINVDSYFLNSNTQNLVAAPMSPTANRYGSSIGWNVTFNLPYDQTIDGYHLNLVAGARGVGFQGGNSDVNLLNTIRLTNVTLTDGTSLSGAVTFDSGFQMSAVPEPSSLALFALGAAGCAGVRARRRRGHASEVTACA